MKLVNYDDLFSQTSFVCMDDDSTINEELCHFFVTQFILHLVLSHIILLLFHVHLSTFYSTFLMMMVIFDVDCLSFDLMISFLLIMLHVACCLFGNMKK